MSIIGAEDVQRAAGGTLHVAPGDRLTPLARERAEELGVTIETGPRRSGPQPRGAQTTGTALGAPPPQPSGPPSAILHRRGARRQGTAWSGSSGGAGRTGPAAKTGRAVVVGAGHVGTTTAARLAESRAFDEVVLVDVVEGLAAGVALDLWHGAAILEFATRVRGVTRLPEAGPADIVVITAGKPRTPGMSRSDLTATNAAIVGAVAGDVAQHSPDAVVIVVSNPLDEMTHHAWRATGFPSQRVLGMAGLLDTARFRALVALEPEVSCPCDVRAVALGSHGEEMVVPLSLATLDGQPLRSVLDPRRLAALVERTRNSGAEVVGLLKSGSAYLTPGTAAAQMALAVARDTREVVPSAVLADGAYGIRDVYIGLPARLGAGGVVEVVELPLEPGELRALRAAASRISERVGALEPA